MPVAPPVSILILTQDEETNLPRCLDALKWCDDILIVDSGSTDSTIEIAKSAGCRILERPFDNFAGQRNYGLEHGQFKHEWFLHLDADEVVTPELVTEIERELISPRFVAYNIPSKMMFTGQWLKYSGMYPVYQVRLTKRGSFRFCQIGHGQKAAIDQQNIGKLKEPYLHYSFSKGLDDWYARHERYATDEACETLKQLNQGKVNWPSLFASDPIRRRESLKQLSFRLPFRPLFRFFYMYFLRLGFLDGPAGLKYCRMLMKYEGMIVRKIKIIKTDSSKKEC